MVMRVHELGLIAWFERLYLASNSKTAYQLLGSGLRTMVRSSDRGSGKGRSMGKRKRKSESKDHTGKGMGARKRMGKSKGTRQAIA